MSEQAARPVFRRRMVVVDKKLQSRAFAYFSSVAASLTFCWGSLTYMIMRDLEVRANAALGAADPTASSGPLLTFMIGSTVVVGLTMGLMGLFLTHRIAGPVFVLTRHLRAMTRGEYPDLRPLRRQDELKGLHEAVGQLMDALRAKDRDDAEKLSKAISELEASATSDSARESLRALRELADAKQRSADAPPSPAQTPIPGTTQTV